MVCAHRDSVGSVGSSWGCTGYATQMRGRFHDAALWGLCRVAYCIGGFMADVLIWGLPQGSMYPNSTVCAKCIFVIGAGTLVGRAFWGLRDSCQMLRSPLRRMSESNRGRNCHDSGSRHVDCRFTSMSNVKHLQHKPIYWIVPFLISQVNISQQSVHRTVSTQSWRHALECL